MNAMNVGATNLGAVPPAAVSALLAAFPQLQSGLTYLKAEVADSARQAVRPYIIGAYALGGTGLLVGLVGLVAALRRR